MEGEKDEAAPKNKRNLDKIAQDYSDEIIEQVISDVSSNKKRYINIVKRLLTDECDGAGATVKDRNIELLLQQNALLEKEVNRLCEQLNEATEGVLKRGYLHMWRDRTISYASRWGLRYFVLQGSLLSYYHDDTDKRPRKTIDIAHCIVRAEGVKKNGQYHVFGIYLEEEDTGAEEIPQSGLILRLSAESYADAKQWMDMLEKAANIDSTEEVALSAPEDTNDDTPGYQLDELKAIPAPMLERVKSIELTLRKSKSVRQLSGSPDSHQGATRTSGSFKDQKKDVRHQPVIAESTYQRLRRLFPASRPMHTKAAPSPLSTETKANEQNYRGFFHLGIIILVMTHLRIIYDNFLKYGWLLQVKIGDGPLVFLTNNYLPILLCLASWMASILASLLVEVLAARRILRSEAMILVINFILSTCYACLPCLWVWFYGENPMLSMLYLMQSVIVWMKLLSYAHTNRDLRMIRRQQKASSSISVEGVDDNAKPLPNAFAEISDLEMPLVQYPKNITLSNLLYFCIVPTLCYQLNYPRSPQIRVKYVLTILFRMIVVAALIIFFVEQYISPTLGQSMKPIEELNLIGIFQLLLRLSVANTYVWLLGFYFFFHLWMNLFAELTRFGDRMFYKDWWNARTIDQYWQRWNLPVHHWMIRHCYYPIMRAGFGKSVAMFLVFLLSALFHEVVISVPFRQLTYHAFLGMIAQAPLSYLTKKLDRVFDNAMIGNILFWIVFCIVGQPMGVLLHYYDLKKHG